MAVLTALTLRNFKCFRGPVTVPLRQATYLVGPNNSGKTAVLEALRAFFDTNAFTPDLINKTELAAKKEGFNRSDISLTFDIGRVTGKIRPKRMRDTYGTKLEVRKSFTWREKSGTLSVEYDVAGQKFEVDDLPEDVRVLLSSVSVSYLHPQEGSDLLQKAQEKFKQRLFHNWGRHASVAERVKALQERWEELRATANSYLSSALTTRLQQIWPSAEVKIELPERIQDVVAVSDITFRSSPNLPQISLPSHGTGAQSTILYQTHYVLDSDRSLHPGMYFPTWLLEEPESFLHADIAMQLSHLLSSREWLDSIQMIISTHSPIILAGGRQSPERAVWIVCEGHEIQWVKPVNEINAEDIGNVGCMMGDANFDVYFEASQPGPRLFLEDSRAEVAAKFIEAGFDVTRQLRGVAEVKRYVEVLSALDPSLRGSSYFVVDSDDGAKQLAALIERGTEVAAVDAWRKIEVTPKCYLILLPPDSAVEDLFPEWPEEVQDAVEAIFEPGSLQFRAKIPVGLSRAVAKLRGVVMSTPEDANAILRKQQDVKDRLWAKADGIAMDPQHAAALRSLIT